MIGEQFISMQEPSKNDDWFVINTNSSSYELRLGGIRKIESKSFGKLLDLSFDNAKIEKVMTDDFTLYIELDNDLCIIHSDTCINNSGSTSFEVYVHNKDFYRNDGGLEGMYDVEVN